MIDKEQRMSSSAIDLIIIQKGSKGKPFSPVVLLVVAEDA